jgi:hypothetical protein
MIDIDEFQAATGFQLETKTAQEWQGQADNAFLAFFLWNHREFDSQHRVCAMYLLRDFDSAELRKVLDVYANDRDLPVRVMARAVLQRHEAAGWVTGPFNWIPEDAF